MRYRDHIERCRVCGGTLAGEVDFILARFSVTYPSRCPSKDECERKVIAALQIEPVKLPDGTIAR